MATGKQVFVLGNPNEYGMRHIGDAVNLMLSGNVPERLQLRHDALPASSGP